MFRGTKRLDRDGFNKGEYERCRQRNLNTVKLFREISRAICKYIFEKKPPYIYFTAGHDSSRYRLYTKLALQLSSLGYVYIGDSDRPNMFYCYKKHQKYC